MRIAQVAPLIESVPPKLYGGIERVVSYLTETLVDLGHEATLFASGDSITSAALEVCSARSLRLDPACPDPLPAHVAMIERVAQAHADFEVVHFHIDWLLLPLFRRLGIPYLTTMHAGTPRGHPRGAPQGHPRGAPQAHPRGAPQGHPRRAPQVIPGASQGHPR
jgi:hypothetical protein